MATAKRKFKGVSTDEKIDGILNGLIDFFIENLESTGKLWNDKFAYFLGENKPFRNWCTTYQYSPMNEIILFVAEQRNFFTSRGYMTMNQAYNFEGFKKIKVDNPKFDVNKPKNFYNSPTKLIWFNKDKNIQASHILQKGTKGTQIINKFAFYEKDENGKDKIDPKNGKKIVKGWGKKVTTVFNATQFVNCPNIVAQLKIENVAKPPKKNSELTKSVKDLYENMNKHNDLIVGEHSTDTAKYIPFYHRVHLLPTNAYKCETSAYSTALHELGHGTGHKSCLNRKTIYEGNSKGTKKEKRNYAIEELTAEYTASVLCQLLGIENDKDFNIGYINNWATVLHSPKKGRDNKMIMQGLEQGMKAVKWLISEGILIL